MSKIIILIFSFLIANANTFNFTELRYSDALGSSMELHGEISFFKNGLSINYVDAKKTLQLNDSILTYKEDMQVVPLDEERSEQITQYLETVFLLHSGDNELLNSMFDIETINEKSILKPIGSISYFVSSIELSKDKNTIKEVKLFLKNSDEITIKIDNEIR
ncbi:hypothetical protein [Sulfurimonas sp.]|uniref:hypothetical protein n=1 Tax=Sulfurimonas sp. TaxID=2022749 RepID=UPI0025FCEF0D|nr:hypothetical protein [Sulfurimonas sp.]